MTSPFPHRDLIGIAGLQPHEISFLLDEADQWVEHNRTHGKVDNAAAYVLQRVIDRLASG